MALPRDDRSYTEKTAPEGEYDVATLDIIKRALLGTAPGMGRKVTGAIKSLTDKGIRASRGEGPSGKYEPNSEFGALNMNPLEEGDRGITHYRYSKPGQLGSLSWPNRDSVRFEEANRHPDVKTRRPFMAHTHPGGGIASAGDKADAGIMQRVPNLQHLIVDTPRAQVEAIKSGKKYQTAPDTLHSDAPVTGTKEQVEDYLRSQERMGISDDWEGAVQEYGFPQGEVPQYLRGALDRMQGTQGWDQDAIKALSAMYPEVPLHEIRNMIHQGALGMIADSPRYKKEFDYRLFTPRDELMEDAMKIFRDKGKTKLK